MQILVNFGDIDKTDAIDQFVREKLLSKLGHLTNKLTRVEVHLRDDNSASKSSYNDKRVLIEARPAGRKPLAVEQRGGDLYSVITDACSKLSRAVRNEVERMAS